MNNCIAEAVLSSDRFVPDWPLFYEHASENGPYHKFFLETINEFFQNGFPVDLDWIQDAI